MNKYKLEVKIYNLYTRQTDYLDVDEIRQPPWIDGRCQLVSNKQVVRTSTIDEIVEFIAPEGWRRVNCSVKDC